MATALFKAGQFAGVPANDTFALAALRQSPVIFPLPAIPWPNNLQPTSVSLGNYAPGTKITGPVSAETDVLVILYTEQETMAFLDVFTGNADWTPKVQSDWCEYAHNFGKFKPLIANLKGGSDGACFKVVAHQDGSFNVMNSRTGQTQDYPRE